MNIFKRLKNLWRLSKYEPLENSTPPAPGDVVSSIVQKRSENKNAAIVVDMHDPVKDLDLGN